MFWVVGWRLRACVDAFIRDGAAEVQILSYMVGPRAEVGKVGRQ
jgi:hypothetical protein